MFSADSANSLWPRLAAHESSQVAERKGSPSGGTFEENLTLKGYLRRYCSQNTTEQITVDAERTGIIGESISVEGTKDITNCLYLLTQLVHVTCGMFHWIAGAYNLFVWLRRQPELIELKVLEWLKELKWMEEQVKELRSSV